MPPRSVVANTNSAFLDANEQPPTDHLQQIAPLFSGTPGHTTTHTIMLAVLSLYTLINTVSRSRDSICANQVYQ